ncbi:MAG: hypothetical protein JOY80_12715 [Candidatus Dormibacteraeota bacterium]|nr:hypothetical protein [Candidatus Dormibacteraeota bacterium]
MTGAAGGAPEGVPGPPDEANIRGLKFDIVIVPNPYHGPGAYGPSSFASGFILADPRSWSPVVAAGVPAPVTNATFGSDGSGSVTFSGWFDVSRSQTESGRIDWTCSA